MLKRIMEPLTINQLTLKNRLVVSAMVTNYVNDDGTPSEKFIAYHEHKAQGGWGLIITEDYRISPEAGCSRPLPGLWSDEQIEPHRRLTERIHRVGGKICCQLYHAGRESTYAINDCQPVAPSAIKDPTMPDMPRALTVAEIHDLERQFGKAAFRAKKAGFDAVEIHGAHGYLVGQFLSPFSNKRGDAYGGTIENRCRFAVEIIQEIRRTCGTDYPILFRFSSVEYVEGGLTIEESQAIAQIVEAAGADCIHCSQGVYASMEHILPPSSIPKAAYAENAAAIKQVVSIPVIAVGRINDPYLAETIIRSGKADMCTMARASLADPELPNKVSAGDTASILRCVGCMQGCIGENIKGNGIRCLMNPLTGMEDEYTFRPAKEAKKILIAGGGIAGCEAAIIAAQRGHQVTIAEKTSVLGGQWLLAAIPPGKSEFTNLVSWQQYMLNRLGVTILYNTTVTRDFVDTFQPDIVVNAIGSNASMPPVPGLREHTVTARQILAGEVTPGKNVAVIGGGLVGAETADHLAVHGHQVSVLEMMPNIMNDGEPVPTKLMLQRYQKYGVQVLTSAKVKTIMADSILFEKDGQEGKLAHLDTIINAMGRRSDTVLQDALKDCPCTVYTIGDAHTTKSGYLDIREGYELGLSL